MKGHFEGDIIISGANKFEIRNFKYDFEGTEKESQMAYDFTERTLKHIERISADKARERSLYPSTRVRNSDGLVVIEDDIAEKKSFLDKVKKANSELNKNFDRPGYEKLVHKLKTNEVFYVRMKELFSNKQFIKDVEDCVLSEQMLSTVKNTMRYVMQFIMNVPDFVFTNMGKIYEDSEDKGNDKLWAYLKMIYGYFYKKSNENIGCIDLAERIYSLMRDGIGEASVIHEKNKWEDDNWN